MQAGAGMADLPSCESIDPSDYPAGQEIKCKPSGTQQKIDTIVLPVMLVVGVLGILFRLKKLLALLKKL